MQLSEGQHVVVRNDEGGSFVGTVLGFEKDGHVAIIEPREEALKNWWPDDYKIGSAHWDAKVTPLRPTLPPPTDEDREAQAAYDDYWRL